MYYLCGTPASGECYSTTRTINIVKYLHKTGNGYKWIRYQEKFEQRGKREIITRSPLEGQRNNDSKGTHSNAQPFNNGLGSPAR